MPENVASGLALLLILAGIGLIEGVLYRLVHH
jgi:hypothetical protein